MSDSSQSIGLKVAGGTLWTVGIRWGTRLLGILNTLILARLLVPQDFGIIAKASLIYEMLGLVTAFGLESALITNQSADKKDYNTVWTIHALRGGVIAALMLLLAYPIADFFREPVLVYILPCYAIASVLLGFANIGTVDFRKHFMFDREFRFALVRKLVGFAVTVSVAIIWRSYWAFVAGTIADALTALIASHLMTKHRVKLTLEKWRSFVSFGRWMLSAEIISALSTKLDTLLLSRYKSASTLGLYTVSQEIGGIPSTEIAMPVARAVMPGLAKLSHDAKEYQSLYAGTLSLVLAISIPSAFGVAIVAEPLVLVFLGAKWAAAAPLLQALAIFGVTRTVSAISSSAFLSFDRADLLAKLAITNLVLRLACLPAGLILAGVKGMAWAVVAAGFFSSLIAIVVQQRVGILQASELLHRTWRIPIATAGMCVSVYFMNELLNDKGYNAFAMLFGEIGLGAITFIFILLVLWQVSGRPTGPEATAFDFARSRRKGAGD